MTEADIKEIARRQFTEVCCCVPQPMSWGEILAFAKIIEARATAAALATLEGDGDWRDTEKIISGLKYSDSATRARAASLLKKMQAALLVAAAAAPSTPALAALKVASTPNTHRLCHTWVSGKCKYCGVVWSDK